MSLKTISAAIFCALLVVTLAAVTVRNISGLKATKGAKQVHVILIGASIGQGWGLSEWPSRVGMSAFSAESIPVWQFDKTEAVDEVVIRPRRRFRLTRSFVKSLFRPAPTKPDIVILKECSSYFPGEFDEYKRRVDQWVARLRMTGAKVVVATVVPVTKNRAARESGKLAAIIDYNDWLKAYAQREGLAVLDLESALRTNGDERYLRDEFAAPDGSHLNSAAYAVLDIILQKLLCGTSTAVCDGSFRAVAR